MCGIYCCCHDHAIWTLTLNPIQSIHCDEKSQSFCVISLYKYSGHIMSIGDQLQKRKYSSIKSLENFLNIRKSIKEGISPGEEINTD